MTIDEEALIFEQACFKHCLFLETDYGFEVVETEQGKVAVGSDISIVYQNSTTSITFLTLSYGQELGVSISRVVNGQPSLLPGDGYGLIWIYLRREPGKRTLAFSLNVQDQFEKKKKSEATPLLYKQAKIAKYDEAFFKCSSVLRQYASDVLSGDFSIFDELSQMPRGEWDAMVNKTIT